MFGQHVRAGERPDEKGAEQIAMAPRREPRSAAVELAAFFELSPRPAPTRRAHPPCRNLRALAFWRFARRARSIHWATPPPAPAGSDEHADIEQRQHQPDWRKVLCPFHPPLRKFSVRRCLIEVPHCEIVISGIREDTSQHRTKSRPPIEPQTISKSARPATSWPMVGD